MSAFRTLQQGITAIQTGNVAEGARLVRLALRDSTLSWEGQALGNIWLAEIATSKEEKLKHYNLALQADPNNSFAQQHITRLLTPPEAAPPPPLTLPEAPPDSRPPTPVYRPENIVMQTASPTPPPPPNLPQQRIPEVPSMSTSQVIPITNFEEPAQSLATTSQVVGIIGGPNGPGSGFFVARNGMIVTTRFVVGGLDYVTVQFDNGQEQTGRVVRAFPDMDIAFVYIEQHADQLLQVSPFPDIPENTPITVLCHQGLTASGTRRETGRMLAPQWFPTDIVQVPDAGGGPIFDDRHYVVGMITRNISSNAAYVYGIHITAIRRCLEIFSGEMRISANRVYCPSCGHVSQAAARGGYYCDNCGSTMSFAQNTNRIRTPQTATLYDENDPHICSNCGAHVGYFQGQCLRCGAAQAAIPQRGGLIP